ncbi:MAG: tRNA pseudouridine(55) synthase TruB [Pseudomonadota bacterium]
MGRRRTKGRAVNGVLLLDKPVGLTSNAALQQVKRLYRAAKAGHTGSLDPLADGLLPICFGEATKISGFLLDADKGYWVKARLGIKTATADAEGDIVETRSTEGATEVAVQAALEKFRGSIEQYPPMYSAVKHKGRRLYELAREGVEVERKPRRVNIYALNLLGRDDDELELEVHCSKGTYVRTLVEDIGERLGCGAHVSALRRTSVGPYGEEGMVTVEALEERAREGLEALDALLIPVDSALARWPAVRLSADAAHYLVQGQPVQAPKAPTSGWVRIYDADGIFLGAGEIDSAGLVAPRRLMGG